MYNRRSTDDQVLTDIEANQDRDSSKHVPVVGVLLTLSREDRSIKPAQAPLLLRLIHFMDKYLIKRSFGASSSDGAASAPPSSASTKSETQRRHRQLTLESLCGVVILEDVESVKRTLLKTNPSPEVILENLRKLQGKTPSKEIIRDTGIGRIVRQLRQHPDGKVAGEAEKLYSLWKSHVVSVANRRLLPVRTDLKTASCREKAQRLIKQSLQLSDGLLDSELPNAIELEIFHEHGQLIDEKYRRKVRGVVFALRDERTREEVIDGKLTPVQLCKRCRRTL